MSSTVDYPKRAPQHIQESRSLRAFSSRLPDDWILRHVTERDYGLDCLVEIPLGDRLVGHVFGAQLKATKTLQWHQGDTAALPGISCSTANYWLGLPFPVFLFLFVEEEDRVFVANVRAQCRRQYEKLVQQETTSFTIHRQLNLDDKDADLLLALFFREQSFEGFAAALQSLLVSVESHADFIEDHWQRDSFLEVPPDALLNFAAFYDSLRVVADYVGVKFDLPSMEQLIEQDRSNYRHSWNHLHEGTLAGILRRLVDPYMGVLKAARHRISEEEFSFWLRRDTLLTHYCINSDSAELIDSVCARFQRM